MITRPRAGPRDRQETATALKLWIVLNRATRAIGDRARADVERHDLSISEFAVLEVVYSKGRQLVGEIGNRVLLTSGSMTYVIDKLEDRGLLTRRPSPGDRRAMQVDLTDKGRKLIARIFPQHAEAIRTAMAGLSSEEKRVVTTLLKQLGRYAQESG